jgi:hypothetical protein
MTLNTVTFGYRAPYEVLEGTPLTLGVADPGQGAPTKSYTLLSTDFPTVSDATFPVRWVASIYIAGLNASGTPTITVGFYQNNVIKGSGTASATVATQYWTRQDTIYDVAVGDVISIRCWCSAATVDYRYTMIHITPTRPGYQGLLYEGVAAIGFVSLPTPTLGVLPAKSTTTGCTFYPPGIANQSGLVTDFSMRYYATVELNNFGFFKSGADIAATTVTGCLNSATIMPSITAWSVPTNIQFIIRE